MSLFIIFQINIQTVSVCLSKDFKYQFVIQ